LACNKCHASGSYKGLKKNCSSCHKDFLEGKFDHKKGGVKLDDVHIDLSCGDCHKNNKFDITPKCDDCHDGFKFPQKVPGLIIKK
jgi:c(7)-type cytochrome triheme protein